MILDPNLTWGTHIEHVRRKILKHLFLLRKARPFINENVAKMLYFTIIQSHLDYCSPVWSNATNSVLNKMRVLQKRALRIVLKCDNNILRSSELFQTLKVDPIDLRWKNTNVIQGGQKKNGQPIWTKFYQI